MEENDHVFITRVCDAGEAGGGSQHAAGRHAHHPSVLRDAA